MHDGLDQAASGLRGRRLAVGAAVAVQSLAVVFFIGDVVSDWRAGGVGRHMLIETVFAVALLAGVVFGARELKRLILQARHRDAAAAAAAGAFHELIALRFRQWKLTPAEADVALFALKGCDPPEIAQLRGVAAGTVRAQLATIYAKAGVANRAALLGLFVDELMAWPPS
jgi:DNA-binding CsgD family transcriptional regulator